MVPSVEPRRVRRVAGATGCTHATMCAPKPVPAPELEERASIRDGAGVEKARRRGDGVRVGLQAIRSPSTRRVVARALTAEQPSKRPVLIQSVVRIRSAQYRRGARLPSARREQAIVSSAGSVSAPVERSDSQHHIDRKQAAPGPEIAELASRYWRITTQAAAPPHRTDPSRSLMLAADP